ncbi:DsbA family protein [Clostridium sp.]|uniref:DsbA family protein n=1 Tax=Clostridium sp. TaxID=1506 RepID=UPI0034647B36
MSLNIKVYTDFVCPFCYLGKKVLEESIKDKDVTIEYLPFELRPIPAPKLDPWEDAMKVQSWNKFIKPMAENLQLDMNLPHISPHPYTNLAFIGYHYAKENNKGNEYIDNVFKAFFRDEKDIEDPEVLVEVAKALDLKEEDFRLALKDDKYKNLQQRALHHSYEEAEISSVPTFVIGEEVIYGVTSIENMEAIVESELNKK